MSGRRLDKTCPDVLTFLQLGSPVMSELTETKRRHGKDGRYVPHIGVSVLCRIRFTKSKDALAKALFTAIMEMIHHARISRPVARVSLELALGETLGGGQLEDGENIDEDDPWSDNWHASWEEVED